MILWVCFTLGNIFGFRAESRSEGARDPLLFSPGAHALTPDQQDGVWGGTAAVAEELVFSNSMPTSWKNGALPRMSSRKKIADYFGITVEELMGTKKEPAGMGELDKQMQEIVALLNSATPEQRNAVETLLRSRAKPERISRQTADLFWQGLRSGWPEPRGPDQGTAAG